MLYNPSGFIGEFLELLPMVVQVQVYVHLQHAEDSEFFEDFGAQLFEVSLYLEDRVVQVIGRLVF